MVTWSLFCVVIVILVNTNTSSSTTALEEKGEIAARISELTQRLDSLETLCAEDSKKSRIKEEELLFRIKTAERNEKKILNLERLYAKGVQEYTSLKYAFEQNGTISLPEKEFDTEKAPRAAVQSLVAFYAYTSNTVDKLIHSNVAFDQVITNIGNGYNKYTGSFTCSVPGLYFFTWDIYVGGGRGFGVQTELIKNGNPVAFAKAGTSEYQAMTGSSAAVLQLNAGDTVWVRVSDTTDSRAILYGHLTNFCGFLI